MTDTADGTAELTITAPHRELLDQVLDKWSLQVLNELQRLQKANFGFNSTTQLNKKLLTIF